MAQSDIIPPAGPVETLPVVRTISVSDLKDVLRKGLDDFWAMPTHAVFLCLIYPIAGIFIGRAMFGLDFVPLLYPLAAGFALIGPLAAIGLYELSRRRELGMDTSWKHAFDVRQSPSFKSILALGGLLLLLFIIWIAVAEAIYLGNFGGNEPATVAAFTDAVLNTPQGRNLIIVGNLAGFLFAVLAFTISVVSFPLLLDRNAGLAAAMTTSATAVMKNPLVMAMWGLIVAVALVVGSLPIFIGLAVVIPVLGHSTWHLYRKVVEPDRNPRPEYRPRVKGRRYAADFPVNLISKAKKD